MSSDSLRRLTEKKGKQLSKFLGIDSRSPSTQVIATMQSRINNPLFKLSITDYEAMCGNKMMIKMMSKVIGCEEKQLKKFCKYINVFKENIKSSPKSIKNKMKVMNSINASKMRGSLYVLPDDILEKIVNKYKTIFKIKYVLKDWVPLEKLNWAGLSVNPNAIELLKENPITKIQWDYLSENPNAIELLKENPKKIDWKQLSGNPSAIELLKANPDKIDWDRLSANPSAIELLKANPEKIDWKKLSGNPKAMELLIDNPEEIRWYYLSKNPNAIELIKNKINEENEMDEDDLYNLDDSEKISWKLLSGNPSAIELLKNNPTKIYGEWLSQNPNPKAIELLKKYPDKKDWFWLSANPAAIELLKANPDKIRWGVLSRNPEIFDEVLV